MTFQHNIDEALEKIDLALYRSASVLLSEAFRECDSPELWEANWPLLFSLIQALLLSGESAAMSALLLKIQARGGAKEADIRISSQLAAFYSLLDSGADSETLESTLHELEILDRQHGGRYRAGVLAAEGVLSAQCGDCEHALESLQRAWTHSRTLGGFCPHQAICEILRLGLAQQDLELCRAWRTALLEAPSRSPCCTIRSAITQAEAAAVMNAGWTVEASYKLIAALRAIECPDLVVRGCGAIIRAVYSLEPLNDVSRHEVAAEALSLAKNVRPNQRYIFDRTLSEIDMRLCASLTGHGLKVEFEYSCIGILLHVKGEPWGTPHNPAIRVPRDAGFNQILIEAMSQAERLDQQLRSAGFRDLVSNRESYCQKAQIASEENS